MKNQSEVLLYHGRDEKNCPFGVVGVGKLRCLECLSQACKPDPMEGLLIPEEEKEDDEC